MNTTNTTLDSIPTAIRYLSKDGKEHKTVQAAINHNKLIELCKWYEGNKIYGRYEGCRIEWEDFIEWCNDNKKELKNILNTIEN